MKTEPPRRKYSSVSTTGLGISDMFIVDDNFKKSDLSANENSRIVSAALLAIDLGILDKLSINDLHKMADLFFTNMPAENELKEIVIPELSSYQIKENEERPIEKNGYFFITQYKTTDGLRKYKIETNIPIASIYAKDYDGCIISRDSNFNKDKVPSRWVAIMNVTYNNDIIIYQGIAYPVSLSPLVFSGTGIAPDNKLSKMVTPGLNIATVMSDLESTVENAMKNGPSDSQQKESMQFLKKYSNLSLSLYAFISGKKSLSNDYLRKAQNIDISLPEDVRGSQCKKLQKLVEFINK